MGRRLLLRRRRLSTVTAEEIDRHLIVNVRATLLLTQAFPQQHAGRPGGRVITLISGQELGPMERELAYSASKAAVNNLANSRSSLLIKKRITVNAVNPGGTNTGWEGPEAEKQVAHWPLGRWGEPDDAARLIAWLCTDDASWSTRQPINSEGGFRRWNWSPEK